MAKRLINARFWIALLRYPLLQATLYSFSCVVVYFPLPVLLGAYVIRSGALWMWILFLFLLTFVGSWFGIVVRRFNPVIKSLSVAAIALVFCALFAYGLGQIPFVATFVLCAILVVPASIMGASGLRMMQSGNLPTAWFIGLPVHFVAFFLFTYLSLLRPELWLISVSAFATLAIVLYALNQLHLNSLLSYSQTQVPSKVRRFNQSIVTLFLGIVLLVFACFFFFVNLSGVVRAIIRLLQHLLAFGHSKAGPSEIRPPSLKLPMQNHLQASQSGSGLWQHIVAIIIAVALFFACLFLLVRGLKAVWRWYQNHRSIEPSGPTFYVDEEESIAGETHRVFRFRRDRQRKKNEPGWNELASPEEQVRYLYRQLVHRSQDKGYAWASADTVRETMQRIRVWLTESHPMQVRPTQFVDNAKFAEGCRYLEELYDKARYGQGGITKDEVKRLRDMLGTCTGRRT